MEVSTVISVACALIVSVVLPLIGYIVTRRDKDFDALKADKKEAHAVLHKKLDDLEKRILSVELKAERLDELRDDVRENKRAYELLRAELYRPRTGTSTTMHAVRPPQSPAPPRRDR